MMTAANAFGGLESHANEDADDELELLSTMRVMEKEGSRQHELKTAPLFTRDAFLVAQSLFPHRGFIASVLRQSREGLLRVPNDSRLYVNTQTPFSAVVCGVQGSGKSHTVSCLLESSLIQDKRIGTQPESLAAVVFHFDEENGGRPCEAAYLSSPSGSSTNGSCVRDVTVLVSPSNFNTMTRVYRHLPNVRVRPLYLKERHLNASRMLSMMGCDQVENLPLYMFIALTILREMGSDRFNYAEFKQRLRQPQFNQAQRAGIELRTNLLDSYLNEAVDDVTQFFGPGKLVIVDLSDPFLDGGNAALLFDLVLGLFVEWETNTGKMIVLDEAHKYLTNTDAARLTRSVSSLIRQQRHLGMRIIVSTQEPTIIPPSILDLTSFIICHKFSSPAWCAHLKSHVSIGDNNINADQAAPAWFDEVMQLRTGQALLFSSGTVTMGDVINPTEDALLLLGRGHLLVNTRPRITLDGGSSVMAGQRLVTASQADPTNMGAAAHSPTTRLESPKYDAPNPHSPQVLPNMPQMSFPSTISSFGGSSMPRNPYAAHPHYGPLAPVAAPSFPSPRPFVPVQARPVRSTPAAKPSIAKVAQPPPSAKVPVAHRYFRSLADVLAAMLVANPSPKGIPIGKLLQAFESKNKDFRTASGHDSWKKFYNAAEQGGFIRLAIPPGQKKKHASLAPPSVTRSAASTSQILR